MEASCRIVARSRRASSGGGPGGTSKRAGACNRPCGIRLVDSRRFLPANRPFLDRLRDITGVRLDVRLSRCVVLDAVSRKRVGGASTASACGIGHCGALIDRSDRGVQYPCARVIQPNVFAAREFLFGDDADKARTGVRLQGDNRHRKPLLRGVRHLTLNGLRPRGDGQPPLLPNPSCYLQGGMSWRRVSLTNWQPPGFAQSNCS